MFRLLLVALTMLFVFGCNGADKDAIADANRANATPPAQADTHDHAEAPAAGGISGEVLETMDAGGYTYVLVKTGEGDVWAAGPQATIAVGDHVDLGEGMLMPNFKSETLDRTFEKIYFVGAIASGEKAEKPAMAGGHGAVPAEETDIDLSGVSKADYTIAEMYALGADADSREFAVRGRVVKANKNIMGTNWYHIQDGSETGAHGDLTITTSASLNVGDLVLITGTGTVDKDFGAGYRYELIIENADVTVESI